jgi:non-homologous end joining protein Ku
MPRSIWKGAIAIIEELTTAWDPGSYPDGYREQLKRLSDAKRTRKGDPGADAGGNP